MLWYLSISGQVIGPYDDAFVIKAIERGLPPETTMRAAGEKEWRALADHPPFAVALRRTAPTLPPPAPLHSTSAPKSSEANPGDLDCDPQADPLLEVG